IMRPGAAPEGVAGELSVRDRIESVADRIERADGPFNLRDDDGALIGHVRRQEVIDVLVGRSIGA
ncbi:glycine betaine/L-proline ABC transporter ATP-binding protein, partial [Cribrihabitans sp. XS_ASV171]